jgi:hypothetical protein
MSEWNYQIRIYLSDAFAKAARSNTADPALKPLNDALKAHDAVAKNQFDAFAGYVAEAERNGPENYPLYAWTKKLVDDKAKEEKYSKIFTVYVGGAEVYAKDKADALEKALKPLVGTVLTNMTKHDSNPATNPQPGKP